jgi:hypothetical protein
MPVHSNRLWSMLYFPGQNLTAEEVSWAAGGGAPGATVEVTYLRPLVSGGRVQSVMPDDAWFRTARLTSRVSGKLAVLYKKGGELPGHAHHWSTAYSAFLKLNPKI